MPHALSDQTVVITGASSGIGRAAAYEFARRGANLVIAARRAEQLEEVARECRALGVKCTPVVADVTDHVRVFDDFIRAVAERRQPSCDGPGGRQSVRLVEAIYQSASKKKEIVVTK